MDKIAAGLLGQRLFVLNLAHDSSLRNETQFPPKAAQYELRRRY